MLPLGNYTVGATISCTKECGPPGAISGMFFSARFSGWISYVRQQICPLRKLSSSSMTRLAFFNENRRNYKMVTQRGGCMWNDICLYFFNGKLTRGVRRKPGNGRHD